MPKKDWQGWNSSNKATRATAPLNADEARAFIHSTLTHPARQKGWAAFVEAASNPKVAPQHQAMAFALLQDDLFLFAKKHGATVDNPLLFLQETQFSGKKGMRHQAAGNAPTPEELKSLPSLFAKDPRQSGGLILWDTQDKLLVYLFKDSEKGYLKVPVRFNRLTYDGQKGLPDVASLFWVTERGVKALTGDTGKSGKPRYIDVN